MFQLLIILKMLFTISKIVNLSSQKCADSLDNGTVRLLVSLYHSHNLCQPANRSREEMIEEYMKEANLKKNISKVLKKIVKCQHEINPETDDHKHFVYSSGCNKSLKSKCINILSISKLLEKLRYRNHLQYNHHFSGPESSCDAFSKSCYSYVILLFESLHKLESRYKKIFRQLGGLYVLLDILQICYIFHDTNCTSFNCEQLIIRTTALLVSFSVPINSIMPCRQLARSPFHITMLVNMIRDNYNRARFSIARSICRLLNVVILSSPTCDFHTLQNCQAIPYFTEIMMQTDNHELDNYSSIDCIADIMQSIFSISGAVRMQFYRIQGAVEFVISRFVEICRVDDQEISSTESDIDEKSTRKRTTITKFMNVIAAHFFFTIPEVQNRCWAANASTIVLGLIKQNLTDTPTCDDDPAFEFHKDLVGDQISYLFKILYRMVLFSERERIKVRELVELEFFRNILTLSWIDGGVKVYVREIVKVQEI